MGEGFLSRKKIPLQELRQLLKREYGEDVLVALTPDGSWVFDPWAHLSGARAHDEWLAGRVDRRFFDVGQRDPKVAPWGQLEIREEPLVLAPRADGKRVVGHVLIRHEAAGGGRVHVEASSVSRVGAYAPKPGDREVGVFQTNAPRIDGDVAVIVRHDAATEVAGGWDTPSAWRAKGDIRVTQALNLAGI